MKPDCSNHKKDLFGHTDMNEVAEAIGDLHYETLAELLDNLESKLILDAGKDRANSRKRIAEYLEYAASGIGEANVYIESAWQICKPFMPPKEQNDERSVARDDHQGGEAGNKTLTSDVEQAALDYAPESGFAAMYKREGFIAGAKWQAKQAGETVKGNHKSANDLYEKAYLQWELTHLSFKDCILKAMEEYANQFKTNK